MVTPLKKGVPGDCDAILHNRHIFSPGLITVRTTDPLSVAIASKTAIYKAFSVPGDAQLYKSSPHPFPPGGVLLPGGLPQKILGNSNDRN